MRQILMPVLAFVASASASFIAHPADTGAQKYPGVVSVKVLARGAESFDFDATISSPYDTPQRYADGLRASGKSVEVSLPGR